MKLYEILDEIHKIGAEIHEAGELTQELQEELSASKIELKDKMDSIGKLILGWQSEAEMLKLEEGRLKERRQKMEKQADDLMWYVKSCLPQGTNFKTPLFTFAWRKSTSVEILDESKLPDIYWREKIIREPDKKQIGDDLKTGATIPGCSLKESQNLSIK